MNWAPGRRLRRREQGQTIALVAVSIVSILAIAALAIDVVTLYSARGEAQRAADAVALAGAKAFVDSGITSYLATSPNLPAVQALATSMANGYIDATLQANKISGKVPDKAGPSAFDFTNPGNPKVTVTLQRTDLPTFFSRIWVIGRTAATVKATAVAEAYNANGNATPIVLTGVKPLLMPNSMQGGLISNLAAGTVNFDAIGKAVSPEANCMPQRRFPCRWPPASPATNPPQGNYLVAGVTTSGNDNLCPRCASRSTPVIESLECSDKDTKYWCGQQLSISNSGYNASNVANAFQCAIHKFSGLDQFAGGSFPDSPMRITAGSGPQSGASVTASGSVMTFPIFDDSVKIARANQQVSVIGFMQAFVEDTPTGQSAVLKIDIMNVIACNANNNSVNAPPTAIARDSVSPVPVRLIHN